jgi:glycoside/pentoside/hexuronide:cation symporter, GPH family
MTGNRPLSLFEKVAYASGQAGNVLSESVIATYLVYFYLRPGSATDQQHSLIPLLVFGAFSTMGFANVVARGIDTFLDPFVANRSDVSQSRFGRRRIFMAIGCLPLAAVTAVIFFPPDQTPTGLNAAWLIALLTTYYALFSVYVAPYLALLPEIASDRKENVVLSTSMAVAALIGALVAINGGGALTAAFGGGGDVSFEVKTLALQKAMVALAALSAVLMAVPVLVIDERRLTEKTTSDAPKAHTPLLASLQTTLSDRHFLHYAFGTVLFSFGFTIVRGGLVYFVEVLMGQRIDHWAPTMIFLVAAIGFPFVGMAATRFGKRRTMIFGTLYLAVILSLFYFIHDLQTGLVLFALSGVGVSVFLALPNAMLSDVCNLSALRTGERREAMFFGAQGFLQKINLGFSGWVLSSLVERFGRSPSSPLGVQLLGPAAAVALLVGAFCYYRYDEKAVLDGLSSSPSTD